MTTKITAPEPLDNTKLHSREEYRRWQEANHAYHAAIREGQERAVKQAEAKAAEANRPLSDDEYYALAVQREKAKQQRQAERDAEERAKQEAKAAYMASMPEVAEIEASNPFAFVSQIVHFANLGYQMPENADVHALPGFYAVKLTAPAPAPAAKKAAK